MSGYGWDAPPTELTAVAEREEQLAVGMVHDGESVRIALFIGSDRHLLTTAGARELAAALVEAATVQDDLAAELAKVEATS